MLDLLYAQAVRARRRWYERHPDTRRRLRRPVISIGNLSVGGTGKTPLVEAVARWLIAQGEKPAILSRGYQRRVTEPGVVVVSDGARVLADLDRAGDEPLVLARAVPGAVVAVSEDRHLAGVLAERRLGATVHVLDDGFQHVTLARDLDVLVTAPGEIAAGRVLPLGRLREPMDAAARAQLVVVVGADAAEARGEAWTLGVSQSCGARRILQVSGIRGQVSGGIREPVSGGIREPVSGGIREQGAGVFAVAGIGNPSQFFEGLREAGVDVRATKAFPDHHRYTPADVRAIGDAMRTAGAESVMTTEKDAVRLEALGTAPFPWAAVPMTLVLDPPGVLEASIASALERARKVA